MAKRTIVAVHVSADRNETKVILDNGDELDAVSSVKVDIEAGGLPMGEMTFVMMRKADG